MKSLALLFGALLTCAVAGSLAEAGTESRPVQVRGTFEVKLDPQEPDNPGAEAAGLMRMSLEKIFYGALDATAHGEMMAHAAAGAREATEPRVPACRTTVANGIRLDGGPRGGIKNLSARSA